jgi:hypothetical protein
MKLGFKCSLTRKALPHINLQADFNWSLALDAVLPSSGAQLHHLLGVELETRLTLAELKKKRGQSAGAHAELVALERVAEHKAFSLIASKAQSVLNHGEMKSQ